MAHAEVPPDAPEQLHNGDFSGGVTPWFSYGTGPLAVTDGRLCTTVAGGLANPWDAGIGRDAGPLTAGAEYELSFDVSATPGAAVTALLQLGSAPYTGYASVDATATGSAQHVTKTFIAPADNAAAQLVFQIGGSAEAQTFCLDDVLLAAARRPRRTSRTPVPGSGSTRSATCPAARRTPPWSPRPPTRSTGS